MQNRVACVVVLVVFLLTASPVAADGPVYNKSWLDERTWPAFVSARTLDTTDKDDAIAKLLKERYNAGQQELRSRYIQWLQCEESLANVYETARRVIEARREAGGNGSDRLTILREKVEFAKLVEQQAAGLRKKFNKASQHTDESTATYFRADAELELLKAEKAEKDGKGK